MKNELKKKYYEQKAEYAWKLFCENKPFLKVYSIVQKDDKFLVLENSNKKNFKYSLAGGGVEEGEDIETATKREILEELNVRVKFIKELDVIHYVHTWHYKGKSFDVNYEAHIVLSEVISTDLSKKIFGLPGEFDKEIKVLEISKEEMLKNVAEFVTFKVKF